MALRDIQSVYLRDVGWMLEALRQNDGRSVSYTVRRCIEEAYARAEAAQADQPKASVR